jgi:carnitine O-acetyltransferase
MSSLTGSRASTELESSCPSNTEFPAQPTSLPRLPDPDLSTILQRLKTSLLPLAHSEVEFADAARKIDAFGSHAGSGTILQSRLLQRANEREH